MEPSAQIKAIKNPLAQSQAKKPSDVASPYALPEFFGILELNGPVTPEIVDKSAKTGVELRLFRAKKQFN